MWVPLYSSASKILAMFVGPPVLFEEVAIRYQAVYTSDLAVFTLFDSIYVCAFFERLGNSLFTFAFLFTGVREQIGV